ncbi:hypothetical protein SAMD00019534_055560 [Acytostelium subglobosum LB1]|uniref:hypothetical protein n=1 Tax=Acytostelium subglobosum LB1 TaxID=1410327 RepID=UPI0006452267|nr:hypothetical protein SAMD00019534_055560 [Acytostelium subglobosum LB1]GAM22381.1 hypothetical protein SAMD00019534_055560 [Acytostelium subglobosum LB1]|eukprot:XP_012754501.1 hypothetical protein SAMD00019534_055560 [Acytostelium subglobosum LB1]
MRGFMNSIKGKPSKQQQQTQGQAFSIVRVDDNEKQQRQQQKDVFNDISIVILTYITFDVTIGITSSFSCHVTN